MKVVLEHDRIRMAYKVWVFSNQPGTGNAFIHYEMGEDGAFKPPKVYQTGGRGDVLPELAPTMVLPEEVIEGIVQEASDVMPPNGATERHLYDAIDVRNRLLSMIEVEQHMRDRAR